MIIMNKTIYLSLGSNVGNRQSHLKVATHLFFPKIKVIKKSPIYETEPWGYTDQDKFLNQVIEANTELSPKDLLAYIKNIEKKIGRSKTFKNGPREIDIDILFYANEYISSPNLTIPHPRIQERAFVLIPLSDIAKNLIYNPTQQTISEMASLISSVGINKI